MEEKASEAAYGIAVDSADNAYVTGFTYSTNFPTTNAIQNHLACTNSFDVNANAFVTEIASGGTNLIFSTYLGGTNFDEGQGIAVDGGRLCLCDRLYGLDQFSNLEHADESAKRSIAQRFDEQK